MSSVGSIGFFLTVEGIEGVGKSTAIQHIEKILMRAGQDYILTREPGGTPIAEDLRKILLSVHPTEILTSDTELLLMFASRSQHITNVILPALQAGKWTVSDRFVDATFAYQGGGRQMDIALLEYLESYVVKSLKPHATILLDASPEIGLARAKNRSAQDRIEQETIDFFERVRAAYLKRAKEDPQRFHVIDATQPLSVIQDILDELLNQWLTNAKERCMT